MRVVYRWFFVIVISPLMFVLYSAEIPQQYSSQTADLLIQFTGAVVSICLLVMFRSYWQYVASAFIMSIVTIYLGHVYMLQIPPNVIIYHFDWIFSATSVLEVFGAHALSILCYWFFVRNGIYRSNKRSKWF